MIDSFPHAILGECLAKLANTGDCLLFSARKKKNGKINPSRFSGLVQIYN